MKQICNCIKQWFAKHPTVLLLTSLVIMISYTVLISETCPEILDDNTNPLGFILLYAGSVLMAFTVFAFAVFMEKKVDPILRRYFPSMQAHYEQSQRDKREFEKMVVRLTEGG